MTEEHSNIMLVGYNQSNQSNGHLYLQIAQALGTALKEFDPSVIPKDGLEKICGDKPLRVVVYDATTYERDIVLEKVRKLSTKELLDLQLQSYHNGSSRHPFIIYNGRDITSEDTVRLVQSGFDWVFGNDQTFGFTPENVKRLIEPT